MNINILKKIGRRLLEELPRGSRVQKSVLGTGASGDKTYDIDKRAEDIIISGLEKSGEALTLIAEESGITLVRGGGKHVLIDPVDGSRNAVSGIPFYCTSIAVADGDTIGDIESAYVLNLINGDEFWSEKGKGYFFNNMAAQGQRDDILYLVAYEAQSPGNDIASILSLLAGARKTRCLGSTALDLSYLAYGAISVFANPSPSRTFDFGAGWLLAREAGAVFTDMQGHSIEQVRLGLEKSTSLLVSGNEHLHEKALKLLQKFPQDN
ncbi:MAG: inositol monophosphatase family protein [Nitrospirota bacterium]